MLASENISIVQGIIRPARAYVFSQPTREKQKTQPQRSLTPARVKTPSFDHEDGLCTRMHNITPHWPGVATGASSEDLETLGNRNFAKISGIKFKTDMNSTTENTNSQNKTTKKVWTTSKHDSVKNYQPMLF